MANENIEPDKVDIVPKQVGESAAPPPAAEAKAVTPAAIHAGEHKVLHLEPHIHVRWHADALVDGHEVYKGFVKDISLIGTSIYLERNLHEFGLIKLCLYVPPFGKKADIYPIEVSGKIIYTAYDGDEFLFHTGIHFVRFNIASDEAYLESCIAAHLLSKV